MKCPTCGNEARGNFCSACGSSLRASECAECGAKLVPGARFCNSCGAEAGAPAGGGARRGARSGRAAAAAPDRGNLPWYLAGAGLLLVIVYLVATMIGGDDSVPARGTAPFSGAGSVTPGTPPPLTGTPREMADRLYNRVAQAREQGDMATAQQFAPMGIQAYQSAEPLDHDGLYHLAIIHAVAGDYDAARATSERVLADNPNHLLALAAAAEAMEAAGNTAAAREYHERFLAAYDTEIGRGLTEYMDHARVMPEYREAALRATGG